jgi:putative hydrolase of the HAD superfamily
MRLPILMFDFGNVVAYFDYSQMLSRFAACLGISAVELEAKLTAQGVPDLARRFERGEVGPEQFSREVMERAGLEMSLPEFEEAWTDIFTLNAPVARLISVLRRQGYTLLLGSNTNILHSRFYRQKFHETLDHFQHFVFSHEIKELKPEPAFFQACLSAVAAPAGSCIFIDDAAPNIAGAKAAGLLAVHYRKTSVLIEELRRLGVEIPAGET